MPYKKIKVSLTDKTKKLTDVFVELEIYDNLDSLASAAVGYLIKQREKAFSIREKAFSK